MKVNKSNTLNLEEEMKLLGDSHPLSNQQESYLSLAFRIAQLSENNFRHGAVIVKSGSVLATAPNITKNDPELFAQMLPNNFSEQKTMVREFSSIHAEERVVRAVGENARGAVVYVARIGKDSQPAISKPCESCHAILVNAGVKAVVYTEGVSFLAAA